MKFLKINKFRSIKKFVESHGYDNRYTVIQRHYNDDNSSYCLEMYKNIEFELIKDKVNNIYESINFTGFNHFGEFIHYNTNAFHIDEILLET